MTPWQAKTLDKWADAIMESGPYFEEVSVEALKLATWMMEAAMEAPEWGRGFVQLATSGVAGGDFREIYTMFPVEVSDDRRP